MSLLNIFFNSNTIECPRCLGKGNVDIEDIRRLKKELFWIQGKCAYCNGKGKVPAERVEKVSADFDYLTTDLPLFERHRVLNGNKKAIERANQQRELIKSIVEEIKQLHHDENKNSTEILEHLAKSYKIKFKSEDERQDTTDFIEKAIKSQTED